MELRFSKMQGLGNDFVVIDATSAPIHALLQSPPPALLARLTDRRFGVGCDQVLIVERPPSGDVDFGYRIFNADGTEVSQCGNGARCFARFVEQHGLSTQRELRVRTASRVLELQLLDDGLVRVNMGAPRFEPAEVPLRLPHRAPRYRLELDGRMCEFGAVSFGNPHAVIEVPDIGRAPVETVGPRLQVHAAFPERVNVGFLQIVDRHHAKLRVYERGAGETLACGSGACAAMVIGQLWGRLDEDVEMQLRGGTLYLQWQGEGTPVWMTGPAETVYEGVMTWPS